MRERSVGSVGIGIVKSLLFSFLSAVPLFLAAHAAESSIYSGTREVRLDGGAVFDGQVLPAGTYKLSWGMNRDRERVEVRLYDGPRVVATAVGRLVDRDAASVYDSVVFSRARTGDRELAEIRFAGSQEAISLLDGGSPAVAAGR